MQDNKPEKLKPEKTTMGALGATLPIGILAPGGNLSKTFANRPWRMKEEREIGDLREKNAEANMGQYVTMVLSIMLTEVGQHKFDSMKEHERRMVIAQMFLPDVFYMYMYLRRVSVGSKLEFEPRCPNCAKTFPFFGALDTLEVTTVNDFKSSQWHYDLTTPIEIRGKPVTGFLMGPPRWNAFESVNSSGGINSRLNTAAVKFSMIRAAIYLVDGLGEVALADHELDELTKKDLEIMSRKIDLETVGPNMVLEGECPACSRAFKLPIEWASEDFFAASGQ